MFVNKRKATVMARIPGTCIDSFKFLLVLICLGKMNQKKESVKQSTNIPVKAIGLAGLGCPLIAVSFSKLHQ